MQKDKLILENIKKDLLISANTRLFINVGWRLSLVLPLIVTSAILIFRFKLIWIGILPILFAIYQIVRYIIEQRKYNDKKKQLSETIERSGISISVEKLSHFSEEYEYDPTFGERKRRRPVFYIYFMSGIRWRIPFIDKHYRWSKNYYISTEGLKNTAVSEKEYFFVTLQGRPDVAYAYPTDFFELDEQLKQK